MSDKAQKKPTYHIEGNKIVVVDKMKGTIRIADEIPISVAIDYLTHLKEEIDANLGLMQGKSTADPTRKATAYLLFKTALWDSLKPSGLLPYLLQGGLLRKVTDFYHTLHIIQTHLANMQAYSLATDYGNDKYSAYIAGMFLEKQLVEDFKEKLLPELKSAYDQGQNLCEQIEQVIESMDEITEQ